MLSNLLPFRRVPLLLLSLCLSLVVRVGAQQQQQQPTARPDAPDEIIRVDTELVQTDVIDRNSKTTSVQRAKFMIE